MTNPHVISDSTVVDATLEAANVLLRVVAQSVIDVEDRVTSPQLRVLVLIARNGPQTTGAIATELGVHPSNASRISDRLVKAGFIGRTPDDDDRRFALLDLTGAGFELVTGVLSRRREAVAETLNSLTPQQRGALRSAFETFASAAGGEGTSDGRFTLSFGD